MVADREVRKFARKHCTKHISRSQGRLLACFLQGSQSHHPAAAACQGNVDQHLKLGQQVADNPSLVVASRPMAPSYDHDTAADEAEDRKLRPTLLTMTSGPTLRHRDMSCATRRTSRTMSRPRPVEHVLVSSLSTRFSTV